MITTHVHLVYFSATYTTKTICKMLAHKLGFPTDEYDVTTHIPSSPIICGPKDLLVVGVPVYAGRIPQKAAQALKMFQGTDTPAMLVTVYGNRHYDDALLELKDLTVEQGFIPTSAAAFIAQHSMFREVAAHRPDAADEKIILNFAQESKQRLFDLSDIHQGGELVVSGTKPYKVPKSMPLYPYGDEKCIDCGRCARLCPEQAIPSNPRDTLTDMCIKCGRCVAICPTGSRHLEGIGVDLEAIRTKFVAAYSARREPELFFRQ